MTGVFVRLFQSLRRAARSRAARVVACVLAAAMIPGPVVAGASMSMPDSGMAQAMHAAPQANHDCVPAKPAMSTPAHDRDAGHMDCCGKTCTCGHAFGFVGVIYSPPPASPVHAPVPARRPAPMYVAFAARLLRPPIA